jgi:hypothetical protein
MSNRFYIDVEDRMINNEPWFDITAYDDYSSINTVSLSKLPDDDLEFLDILFTDLFTLDSGIIAPEFYDLMNFIWELEKSLYIRDTLYPFEQLKTILEKHLKV